MAKKKRKGSDKHKKGPPKKPKASRSPQGKQRQERRDGWNTRRRQVIKVPEGAVLHGCRHIREDIPLHSGTAMLQSESCVEGWLCSSWAEQWHQLLSEVGRGRNNVKNKIVAHLRLRMGIHHKQRKLVSLAALVLLAKCLVGPPTPGFHPALPPPSVQPPPAQGAAPLDPLPGSLAAGPAAGPAQPAWQPKLQERSSSRLASRRPLPPAPVPPQPLNILDPLLAQRVKDWTSEFAAPGELSGWKQLMRGPAHKQFLRQIPKAFFADPDNAAITAKLVELDKTELLGDSNTIGALAKQMAVNTQEMFANPECCLLFLMYGLMQLEEEAASMSQQEWGTRKQLVVFFGNAAIGTRGGWGAKAVLQACRKVVERANSGNPTDRVPGKVVTVDEFRTSRVSSILNSPQPCEEELDSSKPTRPKGWKPKPGQVQDRLLRSAWSKRFEAPVRGLMWCPWLAQATPGKLGKWVDRDCNAALNLQRAGESRWRPLELCRWQHRGRLPAQGREYPALGFKKLRERAPKAQAQQPVAHPPKPRMHPVKHASGLNNARRTTQRWLAPIKPHLQHLAAASSAGTSLEANLKHITVTLATWHAVWEVYLDPKWARQRLRLYGAQDRALEQFFKRLEEEMSQLSMKRHGHAKQLVVFFGAAGIGTGGGWGADAVLRACCKVVCEPRGLMWCPVVAPCKPPQAPRSSQEATPAAASEPGPSTPPPAKRNKRIKAEPAAKPTKGKGKVEGKAAKAKPAPQPGRWLDRDCNAALNMQRIGESRWRPLELCFWPDQGALPAKGKEYPSLGYKRLRDKPPKAQQQQ
ncbi:hypothetical protein QJQ45_003811 [Haematococcus lacustris]|nr:hypothetical protein QJQ45_003811 [Haematococcus lacustris]